MSDKSLDRSTIVAVIVEGEGEVVSVPILLHRVYSWLCGHADLRVLPPIRIPRGRLVKSPFFEEAVRLAHNKLRDRSATPTHGRILCLLDADDDLPCQLAPGLASRIPSLPVSYPCDVVVANVEFEAWLIAGAEGYADSLDPFATGGLPEDVEAGRMKKAWLIKRLIGGRYSPAIDQVKLTRRFDLPAARHRSRSFRKLCKVVASWRLSREDSS